MLQRIISTIDTALDYIFPVGGGVTGSIIGAIHLDVLRLADVAVCAAVGAVVGVLIKWLMGKIIKYLDKLLKK